jgi:hypothetical protein
MPLYIPSQLAKSPSADRQKEKTIMIKEEMTQIMEYSTRSFPLIIKKAM